MEQFGISKLDLKRRNRMQILKQLQETFSAPSVLLNMKQKQSKLRNRNIHAAFAIELAKAAVFLKKLPSDFHESSLVLKKVHKKQGSVKDIIWIK